MDASLKCAEFNAVLLQMGCFLNFALKRIPFHSGFQNEVCAFQNKQLDGDHIWYLLILGEELLIEQD